MLDFAGNTAATGMYFTQEQVRMLANVSVGDMRQWRSLTGYLCEKSGKAARFTFNDVVAVAAIAVLSRSCGLRVRTFGAGIDSLFRRLADIHPTNLQGVLAVIHPHETRLLRFEQMKESDLDDCCCVVRLDPVLESIKQRMSPFVSAPVQSALPFPPRVLEAGR